MNKLLLLGSAAVLLICACRSPQSPPVAAPPQYPDGPPAGMEVCEVELAGRVSETVTGNRAIITYVSDGDCSGPDARILARTPALGDGEFFAEVFVPCGIRLGICAAVEPKVNPDKVPLPTRHYGAYGQPLVAQGVGEIELFGLKWGMADGPEKTFGAPRPYFSRPKDRPMRPDHPLQRAP